MALVNRISYEEELKKNPDLKESDMQMLREWLSKQPHLPAISDSELALFLHSNYYHIESTKTTIDTFYTVRTHVPEFFSNRDPLGDKGLRQALKVGAYIPLSEKSKFGHKIIYCRLVDGDASHYVYNDNIKYFLMVMDLWLATEGTCDGHVILVDMAPVTFGHAGRLNPMGLKKFLYYLQEGMPVRLKGLHFMNTSAVMDIILNMMKPFMKKELMDVLHLHSSMESLEQHMSRSVLPSDFGGQAPTLKELQENQVKQIEEHRAWFINEESTCRVNEHLRPGKQKNATDLFGVEGSFKKLDID